MKYSTVGCLAIIAALVGGAWWLVSGFSPELNIFNQDPPTINQANQPDQRAQSRYLSYSKEAFDAARGKKRVYFFHATWCPTCKAAHEELTGNPEGIPEDVMVFKTDYDSERELKKKYGITSQHTFVLVDEDGTELKKWNGGGLSELAANTK